jgi:WD40 repeat protein
VANGSLAIQLWDVMATRPQQQFQLRTSDVYSVALSPDGKAVAVGSEDATVSLLEVRTGKALGKLPGHKSRVRSVAFSPDGKTLATGGDDLSVFLWNVADLGESR